MAAVINFVNHSVIAALGWFSTLLAVSNMTEVYLTWIFIFLVGRFFLMPILGAGLRDQGSDMVRKIKGNNSSSKVKGK